MIVSPHGRVDTVRSDQNVAVQGDFALVGLKRGRDAFWGLFESGQAMAGFDVGPSEPFDGGIVQDLLQLAAMDRELWDIVSGIKAARLAEDVLPGRCLVDQVAGADTHRVQCIEQPEVGQLFDRMGQRVDPDTELFDFGGLFADDDLDPARMKGNRRGQAANPASDYEYPHENLRLLALSLRVRLSKRQALRDTT